MWLNISQVSEFERVWSHVWNLAGDYPISATLSLIFNENRSVPHYIRMCCICRWAIVKYFSKSKKSWYLNFLFSLHIPKSSILLPVCFEWSNHICYLLVPFFLSFFIHKTQSIVCLHSSCMLLLQDSLWINQLCYLLISQILTHKTDNSDLCAGFSSRRSCFLTNIWLTF